MWGSGRSFLGCAHAHEPCANSSKVTCLKKNHTFTRKVAECFICLLRRQRQHMSALVGWPGVSRWRKQATLFGAWWLKGSQTFLHITLFFFFFGNSSVRDVQHWRLKWGQVDQMSHQTRRGIAQTEPKTVTAWIAAPHASELACERASHIW